MVRLSLILQVMIRGKSDTMRSMSTITMAASATFHCLLGCAVGEIAGMIIGTHLGWDNVQTIALAIIMAFVSGYGLSTLPIVRSGMRFVPALRLVLVADTISILTMEIVDNLVMWIIPGAMDAHFMSILFWLSMGTALAVAFVVVWPVNYMLLQRGKGHALIHHEHGGHDHTNA